MIKQRDNVATVTYHQFKQVLEANNWKLLDCSEYRLNKSFCVKYGHDTGYILKSPKGAWHWCEKLEDVEAKLKRYGMSYFQLSAMMSEPGFARLNDRV